MPKMLSSSKKRKREVAPEDVVPRALQKAKLTEETLKEYIDGTCGQSFAVRTLPRKHNKQISQVYESASEFHERLNIVYRIDPGNAWESMKTFKRFTLGEGEHSLSVGSKDYIYVKYDDDSADAAGDTVLADHTTQWKAQVLETRALDGEHVFVLVAWLYRPEDLPNGRQPYHGHHELVPSNHLDVIDAMSVNGKLDLVRWDEEADIDHSEHQYYWRQVYDAAYTSKLTPLQPMCLEKQPSNPDDLIVQCTNDKCRKWMHVDCIAKRTLSTTRTSYIHSSKPKDPKVASQDVPKSPMVKSGLGKDPSSTVSEEGFTADVYLKDTQQSEEPRHSRNAILVTGPDGHEKSYQVVCLFCNGELE